MRIVDYISHFIFCQSRGLRPNKGFPWAQGKLTEGIRTLQIPSVIFLENDASPYRAEHGKGRLFVYLQVFHKFAVSAFPKRKRFAGLHFGG